MAQRSEAKSVKRRFATKKLIFFETKFRFALFALLLLAVTSLTSRVREQESGGSVDKRPSRHLRERGHRRC